MKRSQSLTLLYKWLFKEQICTSEESEELKIVHSQVQMTTFDYLCYGKTFMVMFPLDDAVYFCLATLRKYQFIHLRSLTF